MGFELRTLTAVACISALVCLSAKGQAGEDQTFRSGVSLVRIDAEATDANHRVLTGLQKEDFHILDGGREQPILSMSSDQQPLDLILLFDISLSMRAAVRQIAHGADFAFRELRQGDRVAVMVFNTSSSVLLPLTPDLSTAETVVQRVLIEQHFGGGTAIQSAVSDAGDVFKTEVNNERRRAILIVTDDFGTRTRREESVVHGLWRVDTSLSGLIVRDPKYTAAHNVKTIISPGTLLFEAGMKGIAEKTGGDVLRSNDGGASFREMLHRIRSRVSLYYRMPEGKRGEARSVQVSLSPAAEKRYPGASVRAREGYVVP